MPKLFHLNRWVKLTSTIVCLIILVVCNVFTIKLANERLDGSAILAPDNSNQQFSTPPDTPHSPNSLNDQQLPESPSQPPSDNPDQQPSDFTNPPSTEATDQKSTDALDQSSMSLPSQPNPNMTLQSQSEATHIPYLIGLTLQSLCISAVVIYLILSHFCKKTLPKIFQNTDKTTIFILGTLLLALVLGLIEAAIITA